MDKPNRILPKTVFNEVLNGLLMLLALRLPGTPAADAIAATAAAWEIALTSGKAWRDEDAPRFQTAFATLAATAEAWPAPAALLKAMPPPPEPRKSYLNVATSVVSWLLTRDHKRIAILYLLTVTAMFAIGSFAIGVVRLNLILPHLCCW